MALARRFQAIRELYRAVNVGESSHLLDSSRSYSTGFSNATRVNSWGVSSWYYKGQNALPWTDGSTMTLRSTMAIDLPLFASDKRLATTQVKPPPQARQMGALKVSMSSPGFIYEPYGPRDKISFWKRWFTRTGWRRTKDDLIMEMKSAYAISKLRKSGYSKNQFYNEAVELYKEINGLISKGDKNQLRKSVTEKMYSILKNEIKQRESMWNNVYWEMIEPAVKIRTLRARLIAIDKNDMDKVFVQLTMEFLTKQKFEAYDSDDTVVAGDKTKEVLVREIWVFEKSLFQPGSYWRLCGRISA